MGNDNIVILQRLRGVAGNTGTPGTDRDPRNPMTTIIPPAGLSVGFVWQPIETAPMDGTEVILFYPHLTTDGFVTAGYFHAASDDYESHWYADLVNGGASDPTHWMPLPPKPVI